VVYQRLLCRHSISLKDRSDRALIRLLLAAAARNPELAGFRRDRRSYRDEAGAKLPDVLTTARPADPGARATQGLRDQVSLDRDRSLRRAAAK